MKKTVQIKSLGELFPECVSANDLKGKVNCLLLDGQEITDRFSSTLFLKASIAILVLSGTSQVEINYKTYPIGVNAVILLSASHLFSFKEVSRELQCLCLFVGKSFTEEMGSTDMIYRRIKYGVRLYNAPVLRLKAEEAGLICQRMTELGRVIDNPGHLYYKELILNSLLAFYLDLSDIIDRDKIYTEGNLNRYESIIKEFIGLLMVHYREEHKVEFYASRLHLSAHYLTLIVKRITGQTVCYFIFEMIYSDARSLLSDSRLSVQEITSLLHFSDQSAFGKFFKRRSGLSPVDYRKRYG